MDVPPRGSVENRDRAGCPQELGMGLPSAGDPVKSAHRGSVPRSRAGGTDYTVTRVQVFQLGCSTEKRGEGDTGLGKDTPQGAHRRSGYVGTDGLAEDLSRLSPHLGFIRLHHLGSPSSSNFVGSRLPAGFPRSRTYKRTHRCGRCLPFPVSGNKGCSARGRRAALPGGSRAEAAPIGANESE